MRSSAWSAMALGINGTARHALLHEPVRSCPIGLATNTSPRWLRPPPIRRHDLQLRVEKDCVKSYVNYMATCTAPVRGHRTASAAAECPACRGSWGYRSSRSYSYPSYSSSYSPGYSSSGTSSGGRGSSGSGRSAKPRWSRPSSSVFYTPAEVKALTPVRETVENRPPQPTRRDVFLCHAWDDRQGPAKELYDLLGSSGVTVWFSEKDVILGSPLLREIDKGLAVSRVGIVLVTPAFLERIKGAGIAEKELSTLLARDLLVPIVHNTTYEALRDVSPLLGSRSGLSTEENSMAEIAAKLAELVAVEP